MRKRSFETEWVEALPAVTRMACQIASTRADREDLISDTCMRCFQGYDSFDGTRSFRNWSMRIMKNLHLDRIRTRGRRVVETHLDDIPDVYDAENMLGDDPKALAAMSENLLADELAGQILTVLEDRPADRETVVAIMKAGTTDYAKLSFLLGIPVGTVRSRMNRLRRRLHAALPELAA